jgi:hypothetical protein
MRDILKDIHFFYFVIIIMLIVCFHKPISKSNFRTYFGVHVLGWVKNQCKKEEENLLLLKIHISTTLLTRVFSSPNFSLLNKFGYNFSISFQAFWWRKFQLCCY